MIKPHNGRVQEVILHHKRNRKKNKEFSYDIRNAKTSRLQLNDCHVKFYKANVMRRLRKQA